MADSNVVLVTGASTGFGRLISVTLARRGYTVFASMRDLTGRNRSRAAELEELGRNESLRLRAVELDVTSDTSVQQAVEQVVREAGRIDAVVKTLELPTGDCWKPSPWSRQNRSSRPISLVRCV